MTATISTDYLIVGSGAVGMAFVDTLLAESTATVVIVEAHTTINFITPLLMVPAAAIVLI